MMLRISFMTNYVRLLAQIVGVGAMFLTACAAAGDAIDLESEAEALDYEAAVSSPVNAGVTLRVTASALNLRSGPDTSYKVLAVLAHGTKVTSVTRSGGDGWVNVKSPAGTKGWASRKYLQVVSTSSSSSSTCDPSRAKGTVGSYQKSLHDVIAWAEGTRGYSKDGYNVMFNYKLMSSCGSHPNQCISYGSSCSTAAGRYQFLNSTWKGARSALNLSSFEPENQELAGQYLIRTVRKVTVPQSRPMSAAEFSNAMSKLSYEWASLPPGRYGQSSKTHTQMRSKYCSLAGC
jgi:muramidase (phage lysozyme)